ncbi:MAG: tRNA(Ile)-lysidine synthase [Cellulomonadaceae bacterium TMED98]|nr:MAG: tRNA(Ile)-lysidine synthase [Cellulomonadaceae bacterium TMED98]
MRECLQRHAGDIPDGALFLIAVSGGADSLALAWASAWEIPKLGYRPRAVIVDHQLQEGSAEVAERARAAVESFGLEADVVTVSVTGDGGLENAARDARYEALTIHAETHGAHAVLLGHTLDDQAETVLLGLTRGSGPQSISGMRDLNGLWWRPFLSFRRSATEQALRDSDVPWWADPHNTDRVFVRPRIRHDVMPVLEDALGPGVAEALARTAELVREDADYLDQQATEAMGSVRDGHSLNIERLQHLPPVIASRVVRRATLDITGEGLSHTHTEQVMALVNAWKGQGPVDIPGGTVERRDSHLVITPDHE